MQYRPEMAIFQERESEARGYCRRFDTLFTRAVGSELFDAQGRRWIDFLAGCGSLNYGHNDADMGAALVAHIQQQGLAVGMDLHTSAKQRFLTLFARHVLAPRGLNHRVMFTGPTGTNAIEAALKLARKVTGRHNVIAFTNGYHGVSMGALATTGNGYNRMGQGALLGGVTRHPYEGYFGPGVDTAEMLAQLLDDPSSGIDKPAAILLEAVQGEGGLNVASRGWLQRIAHIAQRHGALLIVDEVQAGCGRCGSFFSFEPLGVVPDLVALSKSISGYGLPMALLLVRPDRDLWKPAEHNGTFRGNNHAFVTASVALEKFWADGSFQQAVAQRAACVTLELQAMAALIPGAYLKGRGMLQGLHVGSGALADRILRRAFALGLVIEAAGPEDEVIKVLAPLTTPLPLLTEGLRLLHQAVMDVMAVPAHGAAMAAMAGVAHGAAHAAPALAAHSAHSAHPAAHPAAAHAPVAITASAAGQPARTPALTELARAA